MINSKHDIFHDFHWKWNNRSNTLVFSKGTLAPGARGLPAQWTTWPLTRGKWCQSSGSSLSLSSPRPKKLNSWQPNKSEGKITIDCSDCQERQTIKPDRLQLAEHHYNYHNYCHYYHHDSNYHHYHYYHYHYHVRPSSTATLTSLAWWRPSTGSTPRRTLRPFSSRSGESSKNGYFTVRLTVSKCENFDPLKRA